MGIAPATAFLAAAAAALSAAGACAQPAPAGDPRDWRADDLRAGLASSFALPVEDLYVKRSPSEWRNALDGLSLGAAFSMPLSRDREEGPRGATGTGGAAATGSPTLQALLRYVPLGHWFVQATAYAYLEEDRQAPWNPDFSYGFGYDDPRPFTLSLVYFNYGGNRFDPDGDEDEVVTRFNSGTWSLGWKFPLPRAVADPFLIDREQRIDCGARLNVTPRYYDLDRGSDRGWKQSVSLNCRAPVHGGWYLTGEAFAYPDGDDQQPWDPDFTYGFGYSGGWPGNLTIQYANYSGNRLPWRDRGRSQGRFIDGEFTISWTHSW